METTLDGLRDVKVYQNKEGYRFSVDALLLSSFVNLRHAKNIVDLGAGSGIIGLLLARKYTNARVLLVELQKSLYHLASKNVILNDLNERVRVRHADIREIKGLLPTESMDIVVSNPPFRRPVSGRLSEGEERAIARHEVKVVLPDLAEASSHLLRPRGRLFMIYHPERLIEVFDTFRKHRLEPKRIRFVHNDLNAVSKIVLIEAAKDGRPGLKIDKPLFVYRSNGSYSEEVDAMYHG